MSCSICRGTLILLTLCAFAGISGQRAVSISILMCIDCVFVRLAPVPQAQPVLTLATGVVQWSMMLHCQTRRCDRRHGGRLPKTYHVPYRCNIKCYIQMAAWKMLIRVLFVTSHPSMYLHNVHTFDGWSVPA